MLTRPIVAVALFLCAVALLSCIACTRSPRPDSVSVDAVLVTGGKGGWWQECMTARVSQSVHCRIWNKVGLILEDEEFLPYDGGSTPVPVELAILPDPKFPGPDRVFLANGRILLPRSRFDELKIFVDWLEGKRSTPR